MKQIHDLPHNPAGYGRNLTISQAVAFYCVSALWLTTMIPEFKYFAYGIPFLAVLAILANGKLSIPATAPPYLVLMLFGIALAPLGKLKGLQDLWLMAIGLGAFLFGYKYKITWKQAFCAVLLSTIVSLAFQHGKGSIEFDPGRSTSSFEATTSFYFGILTIWAALERKLGRVCLALVLCVLTLKRIAVLAAFICVLVVVMPRRPMDLLLRPIPMLVLNIAAMGLVFAYALGSMDVFIANISGQSPDQLGMGRQQLYHAPISLILSNPWKFLFVGIGPGGIYDMLLVNGHVARGHQNLHNDSLKILVEYGGIAWTAFFLVLFAAKRFEVRVLMLYLNIMFLTDNTLIYHGVIFCVALAASRLTEERTLPKKDAVGARPFDQLHVLRSAKVHPIR